MPKENLTIERIILISGHISSGKSTLANGLAARYGMDIFRTKSVLERRLRGSSGRKALQLEGERLDNRTRGQWVADELVKWVRRETTKSMVVVDAVRVKEQVDAIRRVYGPRVTHIHLTASSSELKRRYMKRQKKGPEASGSYVTTQDDTTEQAVDSLASIADAVIDTNYSTGDDVLVRAASHLRIDRASKSGYVDVMVGGQYGSEGKGQVAAYLASEYDLLIRVGGPNAGHSVYEEPTPYAHHQLPSGTRRCEAPLLIAAGAVLNVEKLLHEIADCGVGIERLRIDEQAMIICDRDIELEGRLKERIGSTGQGVGWATARRIQDRGATVVLARDVPELKPFLGDGVEIVQEFLSKGGRVFVEGTQGTGLSLYHGRYPHVTSRDTTVSGCLAEVGIPPSRIRKAIMVCRTYPIRVASPTGGTSGPMSQEITWKKVSRRSGLSHDEILRTEKTTTTHRDRRVAEFDWSLLRRAALLNGPTDIALTFADYLDKKNRSARRFDQLTPATIDFIQEIERVAEAPVSFIATRFNFRSIIDRRTW